MRRPSAARQWWLEFPPSPPLPPPRPRQRESPPCNFITPRSMPCRNCTQTPTPDCKRDTWSLTWQRSFFSISGGNNANELLILCYILKINSTRKQQPPPEGHGQCCFTTKKITQPRCVACTGIGSHG